MRPADPTDNDKMNAGVVRSMQLGGYDCPIRKLCKSGDIRCVTIPPQVRQYLAIQNGDWLLFKKGPWPGVVTFTKLTADKYDCIAGLGGRDSLKLARKVQGRKHGARIAVPPAVRKMLFAEVGDNLMFSQHLIEGVITVSAVKGGDGSGGASRPG